ncbi:Phox homology [Dillenia turbinata]|uniref:Phox homology n=1 Tax=Dillenia turbinata TaxID=194707 RepID=A0AAN8YR65_9MAGN
MNVYGQDLTLLHLGFSDHPIIESLSNNPSISSSVYESTPDQNQKRSSPPPKHRHDGTSPLPLGMDWSPPPRKWDGRNSVWPHDPHTGWSYCVTIPSWVILPKSSVSDTVVFYRVQVGIQSPDGVTTIRGILRRFSDFLRLFAELKKAFPKKYMPTAPPKRLLKTKSRTLVEERRCSLEDWLEKLLSDIDLSRSALVATFLGARSCCKDVFSSPSIAPVSSDFHLDSDVSLAVSSAIASDSEIGTPNEDSEIGTPRWGSDLVSENLTSEQGFSPQGNKFEVWNITNANSLLWGDFSLQSSMKASEISNFGDVNSFVDPIETAGGTEASQIHGCYERQRIGRVLTTVQRTLVTAKTDMEDSFKVKSELAVKQYLTMKVKDLEVELEATKHSCKESMQQSVFLEKRKIYSKMWWDLEELRRKCLELELKLKMKRVRDEVAKESIVQENEMLLQELDVARERQEKFAEASRGARSKIKGRCQAPC